MRRAHRVSVRDGGSALVVVTIFLPVLLVTGVFAVDVANWLVHKRHLQTQADAAALAGIGQVRFPGCTNALVETTSRIYAGLLTDPLTLEKYNQQVSGTQSNVHLGGDDQTINRESYFEQPGKPSGDPTDVRPPCTALAVDVKLTEKDLPWYFQLGNVEYINAHARAELRTRTSSKGTTPVGVIDPTPTQVRVWFVDEVECAGAAKSTCVLDAAGPSGTTATAPLRLGDNSTGALSIWSSDVDSLKPVFKDTGSRVGMIVALSARKSEDLNEDIEVACGQQTLVVCYDSSGPAGTVPANGIVHVRTYAKGGLIEARDGKAPIARDVRFTAGSTANCRTPDAYFAVPCTRGTPAGASTLGVQATVDFGVADDPMGNGRSLEAQIDGDATKRTMVYDATDKVWRTVLPLEVKGTDPREVKLLWKVKKDGVTIEGDKCGSGQGCSGEFLRVQRTLTASDERSGPIRLAQIGEPAQAGEPEVPGTPNFGANSFARCATGEQASACTRNLSVTIGLTPGLRNETMSGGDPIELRSAGNGSEKTGAITCDPNAPTDYATDLAEGCQRSYAIFTRTPAPWSKGCSAIAKSDYTVGTQNWQCAPVTGSATPNEIGRGLNRRILGTDTTCTNRNNWEVLGKGIDGNQISPDDPRAVRLFIAPFGSFDTASEQYVPIRDFGFFYITGWQGSGEAGANPCQDPLSRASDPISADDPAEPGQILGHYFKEFGSVNEGGAGEEGCDLSAFSGCIPVLTR